MATTSQIRSWYDPPCTPKGDIFLGAFRGLDAVLKDHGYKPRQADTGSYNCRRITGGTGYSLHSYGPGARFTFWSGATVTTAAAVDVNWQTNPYGPRLRTDMPAEMIRDIKRIRTNSGAQVFRWGGDYAGNKDAMHFEVVCTPRDLKTGIDPRTLPGYKPPTHEDDMTPEQDKLLRAVELRSIAFDQRLARLEKQIAAITKALNIKP